MSFTICELDPIVREDENLSAVACASSCQLGRTVGRRDRDAPEGANECDITDLELDRMWLSDYPNPGSENTRVIMLRTSWLVKSGELVNKLAFLEDDWDGEGSPTPPLATRNAALSLLVYLDRHFRRSLPIPGVYPMPDGGVQFEWTSDTKHVEIEFRNAELVVFLTAEQRDAEEDVKAERCSPQDTDKLLSLLHWFMTP